MITVKAPEQYWNEPDLLFKSGSLIAPLGKTALIIAGKKALDTVRSIFLDSLDQSGIAYSILEFGGKVTTSEVEAYTVTALEKKADVVIGIGGGKALDLSKAVGGKLSLPVVAVPTVAATCASWAAVSVLYDDLGRSSGYLLNQRSPALVLADTRVLAAAPKRYLASGIGDTIVKWYETVVNSNDDPDGLDIRFATQTAKLALDRLHTHSLQAYETAGTGKVTPAFTETIDAVIVLAGLAGTLQGSTARAAIAHSIHNSLTFIPQTSGSLHGEKVAFGLLTQVVLEQRTEAEINQLAIWLHKLGLPLTLKELGIVQDPAIIAIEIARRFQLRENADKGLSFEVNESLLIQALQQADQWGRRIIQEAYTK
ncbi:iron-containing alcohol dehydrogenase family protein [Paenibacillus validus]|uniref:Iron-containing alcohol dehydrogenase n=1 Tax=Paenibacillus validus TaxID=44253 RepID=A0A7X2Z838_9BACL|nr:iron-containing alcohol dehydrogenase family protein [Paenibacillus validus]MUG69992.1 iron-containing alcohol dehydrogenase [Paenibacillus validus]